MAEPAAEASVQQQQVAVSRTLIRGPHCNTVNSTPSQRCCRSDERHGSGNTPARLSRSQSSRSSAGGCGQQQMQPLQMTHHREAAATRAMMRVTVRQHTRGGVDGPCRQTAQTRAKTPHRLAPRSLTAAVMRMGMNRRQLRRLPAVRLLLLGGVQELEHSGVQVMCSGAVKQALGSHGAAVKLCSSRDSWL